MFTDFSIVAEFGVRETISRYLYMHIQNTSFIEPIWALGGAT
jgi:hypothetical protein